jgi:hypothetical protein
MKLIRMAKRQKKEGFVKKWVAPAVLAAGVIGAGIYGMKEGIRYNNIRTIDAQRQTYGTVENPGYKIVSPQKTPVRTLENERTKFNNYASKLDKISDILVKDSKSFDGYDKVIDESNNLTQLLSLKFKFMMVGFDFSRLGDDINRKDPSMDENMIKLDMLLIREGLSRIPLNEQEKKYGDIMSYGDNIFKSITGKDVPITLTRDIGDIKKEGWVAYHDSLNEAIVMEDLGYEFTLLSQLHEMGHAVYRGLEDFIYEMTTNRESDEEGRADVRAMEEAAAYLFSLKGVEEVKGKDKLLGKKMDILNSINRFFFVNDFSNGLDEEHARGWALADSLLQHYNGDVTSAFNYLNTKASWDELSEEALEGYREFRSKPFDSDDLVPIQEKISYQIKQFEEKLEGLERKTEEKLDRKRKEKEKSLSADSIRALEDALNWDKELKTHGELKRE